MEQVLTFDQLPHAVTTLISEISELKHLLTKQQEHPPTEQPEQLLTIQEAANLLHLTVPTLYSKHSKGELPGVCKRGKRLYFSKQCLIEWVQQGRQKSNAEIEADAVSYISKTKKGLNNGR
jgi:excisionase family DNA binding protein